MLSVAACIAAWAVGSTAVPTGTGVGVRIIDNLYDTDFASATEGWAVGGFGSIYHTSDGGRIWQAQQSKTLEQLFGVAFADTRTGWIVGRTGIVLHTADGGQRWERQETGNDKHLFHVAALDAQEAWAVGDWGAVLATRDGGQTWEDHTLARDVILYSQSWPDRRNGWIVGELGAILRTADGGATWQEQTSGIEKTLFGVHFADAQRGWACGLDGLILRTEDGGANWGVQRGNSEVGALDQVGVAEALEFASLYDITLAGDIGWAVGDIGSIFLTTDGGRSWQRRSVPGEWKLGWMRAATLTADGRGMFVGINGSTVRVEGTSIELLGKN